MGFFSCSKTFSLRDKKEKNLLLKDNLRILFCKNKADFQKESDLKFSTSATTALPQASD